MYPEQTCMLWPCGGMWLFPLIILGIMIIFCFLFFMRKRCNLPWWGPGADHRKGGDLEETAEQIVKKRYAKGEITKEEFEQMKKDISD